MKERELFGLYYIVDRDNNNKILFAELGFRREGDAIRAIGELLEKDPSRDLAIMEGYYIPELLD